MSGMRFLSAVNQSHTFSSSLESKSDNESVLQNPKNREFLEKQGYYLRHSMDKKVESPLSKTGSGPDGKATKLSKAMSLDASERRKKFHQTRSRNFSQLETSGSDEPSDRGSYDDKRTVGFSRSFTSFENSDSFDSAEFNESRESPMDVFTQFSDDDLPQRSKVSLGDISPGLFNRRKTFSVDSKERSSEELIEPEEILGHATVPRTSAYSGGLQKIAELRKNQVNRFMTMQDADEDYVVSPITSPNLSKEPSLESTLTVTDMQKLKKKSSTLKNDSVFDDVDGEFTERETTPLASPKNVTFKLGDSRSQESEYPENIIFSCIIIGGMGRMESIQSDSSGFADGDAVTGDAVQEERASSLGSSVESDQTFRSFITVVGDQPPSPRLQVISPYSHDRNVRQEEPPSFRKVDVAVGTDDLNFLEEIPKSKEEVTLTPGGRIIDSRGETVKDKPYTSSVSLTPTITYQLHQRDKEKTTLDESGEDNSVVLTIELPTEWLQNGPSDTPPKSSVVSTLYKHIGPPQNMPKNSNKVASSTNDLISSSRHHATSSNSIDHSKTLTAKRQSYLSSSRVHPQWSSTPSVNVAKRQIPKLSENLTRSQIVSPKRTLFSKLEEDNRPKMPKKIAYHSEDDLLGSRPLSPSSVSDMDEFILPIRSNRDNPHTYRRFNRDLSFEDSNASLLSASESCLSLPGENMEYKKLLRLVNKPVSKKLLEEEIHLLQKALAKYRADLNSMEMVFTVKNKMAGSDMTPDERDELEQLKQIWEEVRMEIVETEQLLEQRLAGLAVGNDQFNPMLAMDVIHKVRLVHIITDHHNFIKGTLFSI
ncbi:hypothetical protein FSP39_000362 [Pinctada imbricata]|uniref:Sperm-specific antigen 2 C-terminal domain-containing protein n=1 Tax=Pinctada imbricata TaxID=66713 RepID=A0AA88XCE3_PINIB|nr:hypothetical protein FSP39_000362 [Pinctada imbricata]